VTKRIGGTAEAAARNDGVGSGASGMPRSYPMRSPLNPAPSSPARCAVVLRHDRVQPVPAH
jgi:hypothetical protein